MKGRQQPGGGQLQHQGGAARHQHEEGSAKHIQTRRGEKSHAVAATVPSPSRAPIRAGGNHPRRGDRARRIRWRHVRTPQPPAPPLPRASGSSSFTLTGVPGGALVIGGQEWHAKGGGSTPVTVTSAMRWDAATDAWEVLAPMPQPRPPGPCRGGAARRAGAHHRREEHHRDGAGDHAVVGARRRAAPERGLPDRGPGDRPVAVASPDGAVLVLGSDFDEDMERGTRAEVLWPGADAWEPAGQTVHLFHVGPVCASGEHVIIAAEAGTTASASPWSGRPPRPAVRS